MSAGHAPAIRPGPAYSRGRGSVWGKHGTRTNAGTEPQTPGWPPRLPGGRWRRPVGARSGPGVRLSTAAEGTSPRFCFWEGPLPAPRLPAPSLRCLLLFARRPKGGWQGPPGAGRLSLELEIPWLEMSQPGGCAQGEGSGPRRPASQTSGAASSSLGGGSWFKLSSALYTAPPSSKLGLY